MRSNAFRLLMAQALAACLVVVLPACGGGGSGAAVATPETPATTPTPTPTPTPAGLAPTRVNTTVAGSQSGSQVFALPDGGFVVAWLGAAQRYAADGSPVGAEVLQPAPTVGGATYSDQGMRQSAPDGGLERVFALYQGFSIIGYVAQRYGADLAPRGELFVLPLPTPPLEPSGAQLQGGGVAQIVYENLNPGVTAPRRVIRRADANGRVYQTGLEFSAEGFYRLIALADGGYAVLVSSASGDSLTIRRFSAQDLETGSPVKIFATDPNAAGVYGELVADPRGGFAVLWWDRIRDASAALYRLRRFDSSGEPREPTRELTGLDATPSYAFVGARLSAAVKMRPDGSVWLAWITRSTEYSPDGRLKGRSLNAAGTWDGPVQDLALLNNASSLNTAILRDGSSITVWTGFGLDGDELGVGMLRHDAKGLGMALPASPALRAPQDQPLLGLVLLDGDAPLNSNSGFNQVVTTATHYLTLWNQDNSPMAHGRWFTRSGLPAGEAFSVFGDDPALSVAGAWANADGSVTVLGAPPSYTKRTQVLRRLSVTGPLSDNLSSAVSNSGLTDVSASTFADGGVLLSWNARQSAGTQVLMAHMVQLLDSTGKPRGTEAELHRGVLRGSATVLRDGSWLALWAEPGGAAPGVYWRRYGVDGKPLGEARRANTASAWCSGRSDYVVPWVPSAAVIDGGFVVAWVAEACGEPLSQSIRVQRFDAAGAPVGGEFMLSGGSPGARELTQLDATPGGGFRALWMANRQGVYFPFTETQTQAFTAQLASASPLTVLPGVSWHSLASFGPLDFVMMADRDALPDVPYSSQHAFIRQFSLTWP